MPEASAVTVVVSVIPGVLDWRKYEIVCPCIGRVMIVSPSAIRVYASRLVFMFRLLLLKRQTPFETAAIRGLLGNLQNEFVGLGRGAPEEPHPSPARAHAHQHEQKSKDVSHQALLANQ